MRNRSLGRRGLGARFWDCGPAAAVVVSGRLLPPRARPPDLMGRRGTYPVTQGPTWPRPTLNRGSEKPSEKGKGIGDDVLLINLM